MLASCWALDARLTSKWRSYWPHSAKKFCALYDLKIRVLIFYGPHFGISHEAFSCIKRGRYDHTGYPLVALWCLLGAHWWPLAVTRVTF